MLWGERAAQKSKSRKVEVGGSEWGGLWLGVVGVWLGRGCGVGRVNEQPKSRKVEKSKSWVGEGCGWLWLGGECGVAVVLWGERTVEKSKNRKVGLGRGVAGWG